MTDAELLHVLDLEREAQTPWARTDPERMRQLLSPDFVEIGASGRRWDRESVLAMLAREADHEEAPIEVLGLTARRLSPDLVQTFWDSCRDGRCADARRCGGGRAPTGGRCSTRARS